MATTLETNKEGHYFRTWAVDEPIGCIQIVHGLGEHCERYDHVARAFNEAGYSVYSMDLTGHGRSSGKRGDIDSFDTFKNSVVKLLETINEQHPNVPKILLGHSMGGLIASHTLIEHQAKYAGAILSAPAIQSPQEPPAWQVALIKGIAKLFPSTPILQLDASGVSRDSAVVEKYMADPLVSKEKLTARFLLELTNTMEFVKENASTLTLPLLIMHGSADVMTAPAGSELLNQNAASSSKTLKIYEGLFHEIFNEPEQDNVISDTLNWLKNL